MCLTQYSLGPDVDGWVMKNVYIPKSATICASGFTLSTKYSALALVG